MFNFLQSIFNTYCTTSTPVPHRITPVTDEPVYIETVSSELIEISPENWSNDSPNDTVYVDLHGESDVYTPNSLITQDPPTTVHMPVETLTAANNLHEKSESIARIPRNVTRYSYVTNTSTNPDTPHNFNTDLLEVWVAPINIQPRMNASK